MLITTVSWILFPVHTGTKDLIILNYTKLLIYQHMVIILMTFPQFQWILMEMVTLIILPVAGGETHCDGVKILAQHPQVGRVVDELDEAFRDWPVDFGDSVYVVRYRLDGERVTILAVRHQKEAGF